MSGGMEDGARLERRWREVELKHGGVCPHEEIDPVFGSCTLCGERPKVKQAEERRKGVGRG